MVVDWRSMEQSYIADSTMKVKCIAASKAMKEVVWLKKFLIGLEVVPLAIQPIILFCDNNGAMTQSKESRNHQKGKHIEMKYHFICEIVQKGDTVVEKIPFAKYLENLFTKTLKERVFNGTMIE